VKIRNTAIGVLIWAFVAYIVQTIMYTLVTGTDTWSMLAHDYVPAALWIGLILYALVSAFQITQGGGGD
jgi:ABC-type polysaccharide/polyol phosphate export permease